MSDAEGASAVAQLYFLTERVGDQIKSFSVSRDYYRKWAFRFRIGLAIAAAAAAILLGLGPFIDPIMKEKLGFSVENWLKLVAFLLTSSVPVAVAIDSIYDFRRSWIRSTTTLTALYAVRDKIQHTALGSGVTPAAVQVLFEQFEAALKHANEEWATARIEASNRDRPPVTPPPKPPAPHPTA